MLEEVYTIDFICLCKIFEADEEESAKELEKIPSDVSNLQVLGRCRFWIGKMGERENFILLC
jgi:hypothetical protein